ncbi:rCG45270, isoform CRA_c [Rattus norvegicus]|uniref:RCG45270, isoform CRA_c n=1 Tax=Rattus norvegicus TaxID=10116 RepID=A6K999_RAT|nr:rCG45270, isoform CRA_c [Rattus norvegicus]
MLQNTRACAFGKAKPHLDSGTDIQLGETAGNISRHITAPETTVKLSPPFQRK